MSRGCRIAAALLVTSSALFPGQTRGLAQEVGVSESRILFGQSAAFSGPARELGRNMRLGIEAAFHQANARDGVYDRKLELLSLDDAYEPEAAIANTHQLIHEQRSSRSSEQLVRRLHALPPRWPPVPECRTSHPSPGPPSCGKKSGETSSTCGPPTVRKSIP